MSSPSLELVLKSKILVRAGAGAGKTTELVQRFIDFAKQYKAHHGEFPRIVVTTFTRKATQEVTERLLSKALSLGDQELFKYITQKSKVHISTIHGVLSLFISRYGKEIGLSPDLKLIDGERERFLAKKILRDLFRKKEEYNDILEYCSLDRVTELLIDLTQHRLQNPSLRACTLEDLRKHRQKKVDEVLMEIMNLAPLLSASPVEAWSSVGDHLKSYFSSGQDYATFCHEADKFLSVFTSKPRFSKKNPPVSEDVDVRTKNAFATLKSFADPKVDKFSDQRLQDFVSLAQAIEKIFAEFFPQFYKVKIENSEITMSDLESFSLELSRQSPESAEQFSKLWNYWMIDEYQDTSPVQVQLLDLLVGESPFFIVGDPQQSIYLFRGARREVFQNREQQIKVGAQTHQNFQYMEKLVNYRSKPHLLEGFNHIFHRVSDQFRKMQARDLKEGEKHDALSTRLLLSQGREAEEGESEGGEGDSDSNSPGRWKFVVAEVSYYLGLGLAPESICILSRGNKELDEVAVEMKKYNIPYQVHGSGKYAERREILDLNSILRFLANPHDNENLLALLRQPWFECHDSDLAEWVYQHQRQSSFGTSYYSFFKSQWPEQKAIRELLQLRAMSESCGYYQTLLKFVQSHSVLSSSAYLDSSGRREANIFKFLYQMRVEERKPGFNLIDFVEAKSFLNSTEEGSGDGDASPVIEPKRVNLMTVHASKGLQFEAVIVLGLQQKPAATLTKPLWVDEEQAIYYLNQTDVETGQSVACGPADELRRTLNDREKEEHERVFYVAVTRAQRFLSLCSHLGQRGLNDSSWLAKSGLSQEVGLQLLENFQYEVIDASSLSLTPQENMNLQEYVPIEPLQFISDKKQSQSVTGGLSESTAFAKRNSQQISRTALSAVRGTEIHRLFEVLKFRPDFLEEIEDDSFQKALRFLKNQKQIPFMKLLEVGFVEWGFCIKKENSYLQGQIDLWAEYEGTLWILDYKTGSPEYLEKAQQQLQAYASALKTIEPRYQTLPTQLVLIYPFEEKIIYKISPTEVGL